jgi:hypothetical protein
MFDYDERLAAHLKSLQPLLPRQHQSKETNVGICSHWNRARAFGFLAGAAGEICHKTGLPDSVALTHNKKPAPST